ncbi:kyphoscoliosis peptidase-like [Mercenaria mercenaria]|uniref:kyphoscoliosis peptidase-like n=1 Tax=Mercenaria mercenaria TaxID=6596 RepID=UPI00234EAA18|nr:kyphoscoliosis peptidase-like [Mercenaria mercenaria]XP_045158900.2 kyphoscoliosis peptidase-like [Mercenaria mercenaria]XP_053394653.1 kyphoscoliosis peptidase-like [Mercenaria mercenaria]XP_053394655.1 kyphoscoliosis peptidase-like [Mercenaria mercenaria]
MSHIHSYNEDVDVTLFHTIDQHAQKVPMHNIYSEDGLMQYLSVPIGLQDKNRNIYLARSVIAFLSEVNIARRKSTYNVARSMTEIIYGSPTDSFRTLCCNAGIEAEVITGKSKGSNYQPGVQEEDCLQESKWCAFKSSGTWHLVHPQWAIVSMYGFGYGGQLIEGDGRINIQSRLQVHGQTINAFNDFWFCTKPEIFIHHCYPDNSDWQLLPGPNKTSGQFFSIPFLQQGYYEAGLELLSEYSCSLSSTKGVCIITFSDKHVARNLEFSYTLTLKSGDISGVRWDDLSQLVMFIPEVDMYTFKINLPVKGMYLFEIMVIADDIVTNASCADFKITCTEACTNCRKVPFNVGIEGFGYGNEAKKAGLKHPSEKTPVLVLNSPELEVGSDCEDEIIDFQIDSDRVNEVEFTSDIIGGVNREAVRTSTYVDGEKGRLVVKAGMKKTGDFTLAIKAREKEQGADFKTVLNYMLTTDSGEREFYRKHEKVVKQRRREITKEQKVVDKTRRKRELLMEIEELNTSTSALW